MLFCRRMQAIIFARASGGSRASYPSDRATRVTRTSYAASSVPRFGPIGGLGDPFRTVTCRVLHMLRHTGDWSEEDCMDRSVRLPQRLPCGRRPERAGGWSARCGLGLHRAAGGLRSDIEPPHPPRLPHRVEQLDCTRDDRVSYWEPPNKVAQVRHLPTSDNPAMPIADMYAGPQGSADVRRQFQRNGVVLGVRHALRERIG